MLQRYLFAYTIASAEPRSGSEFLELGTQSSSFGLLNGEFLRHYFNC